MKRETYQIDVTIQKEGKTNFSIYVLEVSNDIGRASYNIDIVGKDANPNNQLYIVSATAMVVVLVCLVPFIGYCIKK